MMENETIGACGTAGWMGLECLPPPAKFTKLYGLTAAPAPLSTLPFRSTKMPIIPPMTEESICKRQRKFPDNHAAMGGRNQAMKKRPS